MQEFIWPVRVYYEDTDAGGVVYHASYLKFFERARTEMLRSLGFEQDRLLAEENIVFAVRSVKVDYLKPLRFNEHVEVRTKVVECRKTNLTFEQTITRQQDLFCSGLIRIACVDARRMKPTPIPIAILEHLSA